MKTIEDRYRKLGRAIIEEYLVQGSKKIEVVLTLERGALRVSVNKYPIISLTKKEMQDRIEKVTKKKHNETFKRILKRSIEKNTDLLTELQKGKKKKH